MTDLVVRMQHIRTAGFCPFGLKSFCMQHGISMRRLSSEGIPLSELDHIEDAYLDRVREIVKKEAGSHG